MNRPDLNDDTWIEATDRPEIEPLTGLEAVLLVLWGALFIWLIGAAAYALAAVV